MDDQNTPVEHTSTLTEIPDVQVSTGSSRAPWWRKRSAFAIVAVIVMIGVGTWLIGQRGTGNSASAVVPASSSPSSESAAISPSVQAQGNAALAAAQCSASDHGTATEHVVWSTLMRGGTQFTDWEAATASYLSDARGTASFDATFSGADAQDAIDAQALSAALAQLDADLQQGVDTGSAPPSYKSDAEAVQAAAALLDTCYTPIN